MGQVTGTQVRLAGYTETAYAVTPGAPDGLLLYPRTIGVKASAQADKDDTLAGFRGMLRPVRGQKDVSGSVAVNIAPQSIGWWLKHAIGTPVTTGAGPYTHTFTIALTGASALPVGFVLEEDLGSGFTAASRYLRYPGCRIGQSQFTFGPTGFAQAQFDVRGATVVKASTPLDATYTDNGHTAFANQSGSLTIDAGVTTACAPAFTMTVGNDLDDSNYCIGGAGARSSMPEGFCTASGTLDTLLNDNAILDKMLTDANAAFVYALTNGTGVGTAGNEALTISVPLAAFALDTPVVQNSKGLRLQSSFEAFRNGNAELGISFVLKNMVANYNQ